MKILLTNDDGIRAEGLRILAAWARKLGDITVAAPETEQSACSQRIVLNRPISCLKSGLLNDLGIEAYSVDSTPADCVRIACSLFGPFDLVFSGINNGFNTGHFINYSGTCAAAFEAASMGIPTVAFSAPAGKLKEVEPDLPKIWQFFEEKRLLEKHLLYNVNIAPHFRDFAFTRTEPAFGGENFLPAGDGCYLASLNLSMWKDRKLDITYDMEALFAGYCSITPLNVDRTEERLFQELSRTQA